MVAFDNTILSILLFPDAVVHQGPEPKPVERAHDRVNALVQEIADAGEQVLVPSPALAEVLATPDCDMEEVLSTLRGCIHPDRRLRSARRSRTGHPSSCRLYCRRYSGRPEDHEDKDEVRSADRGDRTDQRPRVLYSDDDGVKKFEEGSGLKVKRTSDLPIPLIQQQLFEGGKFTLSEQSDSANAGKSAGPEPKPE
jgi:hypothetical protein